MINSIGFKSHQFFRKFSTHNLECYPSDHVINALKLLVFQLKVDAHGKENLLFFSKRIKKRTYMLANTNANNEQLLKKFSILRAFTKLWTYQVSLFDHDLGTST